VRTRVRRPDAARLIKLPARADVHIGYRLSKLLGRVATKAWVHEKNPAPTC